MPCVRIATGEWVVGRELELIEAVQAALVTAFRIPESDRDVVLDVYGPQRRIIAPGQSERYTRVEIVGIAARSIEAKRLLFRTIVENMMRLGVPERASRIVLVEPPGERWGVKGGRLASEVDMGFRIDV